MHLLLNYLRFASIMDVEEDLDCEKRKIDKRLARFKAAANTPRLPHPCLWPIRTNRGEQCLSLKLQSLPSEFHVWCRNAFRRFGPPPLISGSNCCFCQSTTWAFHANFSRCKKPPKLLESSRLSLHRRIFLLLEKHQAHLAVSMWLGVWMKMRIPQKSTEVPANTPSISISSLLYLATWRCSSSLYQIDAQQKAIEVTKFYNGNVPLIHRALNLFSNLHGLALPKSEMVWVEIHMATWPAENPWSLYSQRQSQYRHRPDGTGQSPSGCWKNIFFSPDFEILATSSSSSWFTTLA